jgi:hypothetical protein
VSAPRQAPQFRKRAYRHAPRRNPFRRQQRNPGDFWSRAPAWLVILILALAKGAVALLMDGRPRNMRGLGPVVSFRVGRPGVRRDE